MTKRLLALFALCSLVATTSCIDEALAPADESVGAIEIVSGNNQSGRLAGQLAEPLVVKVTTKAGQPVTGATVTFDPDTGSGTASSATALSDAAGLARVNWTLGSTFGTKTLVAKAGGDRKVTFTATTVPDRLELASGNNQIGRASAELTGPVVVKVVDLAGRPAGGVAVTFAPETGSGSVVPSLVSTEPDGTARAVWTLGSAPGPKVLRVTAATATSPVTVNATATQDVLTVVSGGNQAIVAGATLSAPVVVQMKDQTGAIVAGAQLTFTPTAGSGTVSPASVFTDNQGRAQTTWTLGAAPGLKSLQVTGGSAVALTVSASALSTDSLQVVSGNAQAGRAGAVLPSPVVVRVLDAEGRAVQGAAVRFAAAAGNGSPTTQVDTTDAQGLAETNWVLGSTLGDMRLTATVGAATPVTISATTTQDRLELVSGGLQFGRVGTALAAPVVVKLVDLSGRAVPGVVLTFTPDAENGTVLPTTVSTDVNGEARTSWTVGASAGPMTLRVSTTTAPTLIVNATAIEGQLSLVSGGGQAALAGTALTQPIVVRVQDQTGTPLQGSLVTFTATAANGTVSPTSIFSDAQGLARTTWTLGATPGAKTLSIAGGSSTLTVGATALTGDSLEIVSGNAQAAQAEQPLAAPLVVRVRDKASGRVVSGAVVTFAPAAGSGTVGAGTATSDGSGLAQTTWTLGPGVGEKTVTATVGGATVTFRATATQDRLELVSGGAQTARPGTALANPVVVRLFDINNRAMAGVEVDFIPDADNGSTLPSRIVTGTDGTARTVWTIGPNPGVMRMTVRAGTAAPITVFATGGRDEIDLVSGGGQVGRVTRLLPDSIAVRVLDPAGLPAGGVTVTFAATDAQSGTPSPATVVTNAQGIARTGWVLGAVPGTMSLTANALNANPAIATAVATQDLMERVGGGNQERAVGGTLPDPIVVRLLNQAGEPLVNEVVTFTPAAGSVEPTTALTNLQGEARTVWTLGGTPGTQTISVRGGVATPVSFTATARATDSLAIVSGDAQAAQAGKTLAEPIVVRVVEKASGKGVPGAIVTFAVTAANGSVSEASVITDALGLARTSWTLGATTGVKTLTVSVGTAPAVVSRTVTATATVERLEVVAGANQTGRLQSTLSTPIAVRVIDLAGAPVSNVLVTFTPIVAAPTADSGSVLPSSIATDVAGIARTVWTLGDTPGIQTLGVSAGAAGSLRVFATATRNRIELVSGGNQSARINTTLADSITVRVVDPSGVAVPNVTVVFSASAGSPSPATNVTNAQGITRTALTLPATAGVVTLSAEASNTDRLEVTARATQDRLTLVSGGDQVRAVGAALAAPIVVQLRDEAGAAMVDVPVSFAATAGTVTGTVRTDAQGQAQSPWTLGATAGTQTVRVNGGTATELAVTATALAVDALSIVSGDAQAAQTGAALANPVVVRVREAASGRAVPGAMVTFIPLAATDGSVRDTTVLTDVEGKAQATWTLGTGTGAKSLEVSAGTATAVVFNATATAARLEVVSGDGQVARPATALANPVVVRLIGLDGQVMPGVTVTFGASGGGSPLPISVVTDATGIARTTWTLGNTLGVQQLTVTAPSAGALTVTATAAQNRITLVSGGGQSARINAALADSVVVKVVDPSGAAVPNVDVSFTTASGSVSPTSQTTDAQGVAKTRWTLGGTAGAVTLTAAATGADPLDVSARALRADSVFLSAGGSQTGLVGAALPQDVVVEVRDKLSQVVMPGIAVTFTPNVAGAANDGTVSAETVVTDAAGVARTTWTLGTTKGTKRLNVATVDAGALSLTATALQDTSRVVTILAGDNNTGTVLRTLPSMTVEVRDRFGNPIVGDTIQWTDSLTNGITVSPTVSVTGADGRAATTPRLGIAVDSALVRARIAGRSETVTFLATGQVAYSAVQTGNFFSCALTEEGRSYCWGYNRNEQLAKGVGATVDVDRPSTPITAADSLLGPFQTFRQLSLGRTNACGISVAKQVVCWGTGNGNFGSTNPTPVTFDTTITAEAVATGEAHSCVLDIDGFVWCGGENRLGQLGNFSTKPITSPTSPLRVIRSDSVAIRFSTIAAGRSFTCGFVRGATLPQCWGDNGVGQLGRGLAITLDSTAANVASGETFDSTSLVLGLQHACALNTVGAAFCWGGNGVGQLGDGTTTNRDVPTAVTGGLTFVRLAAGENHTCGLTATGTAHCWGQNTSGQLGNNSTVSSTAPVTVTLPAGVTGFRSLSLGELHSCAITGTPTATGSGTTTATGTVYCWGDNEYGQLGDGAASGNAAPVLTPKRVVNQPSP